MELLSPQDYYNSLAKKPMGADVIFFNDKEEILIVKPNYKNEWLIPGGTTEKNESPRLSAIREVKEEIGLDIEIRQMLCIDYSITEQGDNFKFVFFGGVLSDVQISEIKLQESELTEFRFVTLDEAKKLFGPRKIRRIPYCLEAIKNNTIVYLENGEKI